MLSTHGTATPPASATAVVTEEDVLRRWHTSWRDTAVGRRRHLETCDKTTHHACGDAE
jgi:hypothetical protein